MNVWTIASIAMLFALFPCGWIVFTSTLQKRLVAMETAGVICVLEMMLLTMSSNRMPTMDLALALALLSFAAGMVFAHFLARSL